MCLRLHTEASLHGPFWNFQQICLCPLNKERKRFLWTHIHNLFKNSGCHLYQNSCSHSSCQHCPCHEILSPFLLLRSPRLFGWADEAEPEGAGRDSICCDGGRARRGRIRGDLERCIVDLSSSTSFSWSRDGGIVGARRVRDGNQLNPVLRPVFVVCDVTSFRAAAIPRTRRRHSLYAFFLISYSYERQCDQHGCDRS